MFRKHLFRVKASLRVMVFVNINQKKQPRLPDVCRQYGRVDIGPLSVGPAEIAKAIFLALRNGFGYLVLGLAAQKYKVCVSSKP